MDLQSSFHDQVALDTKVDTLCVWGIISGRTRNALVSVGILYASDILKLNPNNLYEVRNAGRKTVNEIRTFQAMFHHLYDNKRGGNESWEDDSAYLDKFPLSREDFSFLSDEQFDWVRTHWEMYDTLPASYILYHYLISSEVRNDIIHRIFFGLDPKHEQASLTDIAAKFDLTRERIRQIVCKPIRFPKYLRECSSILQNLHPKDNFCFELNDLAYILEREKLDISLDKYADFLCCIFNYVSKVSVVPDGKVYLVRKKMVEQFPIHIALKSIDQAFTRDFAKASETSLDKLVKLTRHKTTFQELSPIFRDYIEYKYSITIKLEDGIIDTSSDYSFTDISGDDFSDSDVGDKEQHISESSHESVNTSDSETFKGRKILEIFTPDGTSWIDKYAYITFVKFIETIGVEKVLSLGINAKENIPLISKDILHRSSSKPTSNGYYVYTGIANEIKVEIVNKIANHFGLEYKAISYLAKSE